MPRYSCNPARLIDRPWRSGHPFRPHPGLLRRIVMSVLLALLSLVIGGYTYITDSNHVRQMAQGYLSKLVGGRVEIRSATLSIFEGLRLEGVEVHVDPQPGRPDSLLFSADTFVLNYDPARLIRGQLESTQIIAQKPHVYLTLTQQQKEDHWNYARLAMEPREPTPATPASHPRIALPEVVLRNAVIDISEVKAGQVFKHGSMYIDGQLSPTADGYAFELQTRGISEELGPYATGTISRTTGAVTASLRNVQFDEDLRSMFPTPELRDWWERHELSGNVRVEMTYTPARGGAEPDFRIQTVFDDVTLAVHREEWSSRDDVLRWQRLQEAVGLERSAYRLAGFSIAGPAARQAVGGAAPPIEALASAAETTPLWVRHVSGNFTFTPHVIEVETTGAVAITPQRANTFHIHGRMEGYDPDAPLHLEIRSADPEGLEFSAAPRFLESLPKDVRQFYEDLRPEGRCRIIAQVSRAVPGAMPQVTGEVEVLDATFVFHEFPYPFRNASGRIAFGRDPGSGKDYVQVINMHGRGMLGGANENAEVAISGRVGPIGPDSPEPGFDLHATGRNICSEPRLMRAMPPDVHKALQIFDAPAKGEFPQFKANFACNIHRDAGHDKRWTFDTDIDLLDAAGRIVGFAYPLKGLHGLVKVRDGYVDVLNVMVNANGGAAKVNGRVRWADENGIDVPLDLMLTIGVRGLPIDRDLIAAMPGEQGDWVMRLGLAGKLDAYGKIFSLPPTARDYQELANYHHRDAQIGYDLNLTARDGTLWPADGLFSVSALAGKLHLTRDRLDILELRGRREDADLLATGSFTFTGPAPRLAVHVNARNLAMDRPLYAMLPVEGRKSWDEVQPRGTVDADVDFRGPLGAQPKPGEAEAAAGPDDGFSATLRPRKLAVRVRTTPYPLIFDHGSVTIERGKAVLKDLVGSHGTGRIYVSGTGSLAGAPVWKLDLRAQNLPCDAELCKALPPALVTIVDGLKLRGNLGFHFPALSYRGSETDGDPDIDLGGTVTLKSGSIDVGVPLADVYGGMDFQTSSRQGKLDSLSGSLKFDSLSLGGRPLRDLKLKLVKPAGKNELHVDKIEAKVAHGELAGGVTLFFPDEGANRYTMGLTVRNADVKELTGETDQDIRGDLTASLSLEGAWGETTQRRGRGDVVVAGKQLYRIPVMLGLLQVTNLSLPIGGPFTKGTARYTVEGTRINFEQVDLRADSMMMTGSGYLDFGTKQVRMNLSTDNPGGFKIPFLHDLWQGARQELLKITVRGTVQDPKVEPTSMGTFTTTVDEVFRGEGKR